MIRINRGQTDRLIAVIQAIVVRIQAGWQVIGTIILGFDGVVDAVIIAVQVKAIINAVAITIRYRKSSCAGDIEIIVDTRNPANVINPVSSHSVNDETG